MKRSQDKQGKKIIKSFIEKNYQENIWQKHYINRMIENLIKSIRNNWKKIRDIRREYNRRKKEY